MFLGLQLHGYSFLNLRFIDRFDNGWIDRFNGYWTYPFNTLKCWNIVAWAVTCPLGESAIRWIDFTIIFVVFNIMDELYM
jgi:hypothetical protein